MANMQIVLLVLAASLSLLNADDQSQCIRERFKGACDDASSYQLSKYLTEHTIEECAVKCRTTSTCRDFSLGNLNTMKGFCYLYTVGCLVSSDVSMTMYSIEGCDHCRRKLFTGGCNEHNAMHIKPKYLEPPHTVEQCEEKCRGAVGCREFSIGVNPAIADGWCYLYTGNCTSDQNAHFNHYAIYGCADVVDDQLFDNLTCTEYGMTFSYFNSHTLPYVNVLKLEAHDSDPVSRYRTRDHPTISSCVKLDNEGTYYNLTMNYTDCADTVSVIQNDNVIIRRAVVEIQENKNALDYVLRHLNHTQYTIECKYTRQHNLSNTFNVTIQATVIERKIAREATFKLDMNIYDTRSFNNIATPPKQVTLNEPIYVEIQKLWNDTRLKMVVQNCWAADEATEEFSNYKYTFFSKGCALDSTFETLTETANTFRFKIDAFVLLMLKSQTYLTCSLYVCTVDSGTPECNFGCNKARKRRSIDSDLTVAQEILVRNRRSALTSIRRSQIDMGLAISNQIQFTQKPTCTTLKCPIDSKCIENYPAFCRCQNNLVMDIQKLECTSRNLVEMSAPTELTWIPEYSNANSNAFLGLIYLYQEKMLNYYVREKRIYGIRGLKIDNTYQVPDTSTGRTHTRFRVIMSLNDDVTIQGVSLQMQNLLSTQTNEIVERTHVNPTTIVKIIRVVTPEASSNMSNRVFSTQDIALIAIGLAVLAVIFFGVICIKLKRNKKKVVSIDNELNTVTVNTTAN